ncbi:hypothetical protein GM3708_2117 [Geminocystis sp. NIES-3708]|uniref:DUF4168 domain-containing protein n=1 Tax=Geminocystis sp. NIES-3708 TaxID=1615909 RepID=UPI0005FC815D|nr:DUF4168 domain-containing protein [Geminocystis sp. NIES-3708]BAQ61711.1 hypothetical protein GM3708_2117 [Geminocystis sp. NIES-3708]
MLINYRTLNFIKTGYQILLLFSLSTSAIALGIIPEINWQSKTMNITSEAMAQNVSDEDLRKYAQAAVEIESLRKSTLNNIESIVGKSTPNQLNCHQEENFNQLPNNARNMAVSYCEKSETIVKKYGLTNTQFNQITQQVRQNPTLKQKLQAIVGQM